MSNELELKLSVSKSKTFLSCKAKYNYSYNLKLPKKTWSFHTLGKFVHLILELFHKYNMEDSTIPFNICMTKAWDASKLEFPDLSEETEKEAFDMVHSYLKLMYKEKNEGSLPTYIAVEKPFSFKISDNVILNGAIDRIQVDNDGVYHVCDYKTTKDKKYLKDDFFQLLTYGYVLYNEDPSIKKIRGSYILIRHNFEYITKEFDLQEILSIKEEYVKYADLIAKEKVWEPSPTKLCNFCDFFDACNDGKRYIIGDVVNGEINW